MSKEQQCQAALEVAMSEDLMGWTQRERDCFKEGWKIANRTPAAPVVAEGVMRFDCILTPEGKAEMYASETGAYVWYDHVLAAHPVAGSPAEAERTAKVEASCDDCSGSGVIGTWSNHDYTEDICTLCEGSGKMEVTVRVATPAAAEPMPASEAQTANDRTTDYHRGYQAGIEMGKALAADEATAAPVPASEAANVLPHDDIAKVMGWARALDTLSVSNYFNDGRGLLCDQAAALLRHIAAPAAPTDAKPDCWEAVLDEVERATRKFPTWPTDPLHAVAVLGEEFGELTKAVLQTTYEPHKVAEGELRMEAVQMAAMALRFLASLDRYEFVPSAQHVQSVAAQSVRDAAQPGIAAEEVRDAARWKAIESAGCELTIRLHNTRPDQRAHVVDAYIANTPTKD